MHETTTTIKGVEQTKEEEEDIMMNGGRNHAETIIPMLAATTTTTTNNDDNVCVCCPSCCSTSSCRQCWFYWRNMMLYWSVGHIAAIQNNYYQRLKKATAMVAATSTTTATRTTEIKYDGTPTRFLHTMLALGVTIVCQLELNTRYTDHGRGGRNCKSFNGDSESSAIALTWPVVKKRWIPVLMFAICNGFFETCIFLATYDFGKSLVGGNGSAESNSNSNTTCSIVLGFTFYYFYMALIHVFFWLPYGLPPHTVEEYHTHQLMKKSNNESKSMATISTKTTTNILPPRPPPFHKHGLPLLTIISITWLSVYEIYHDLLTVCLLHCVVDFCLATKIRLQLPPGTTNI
mmetsp:Transcript_48600/g.117546  ORF Transcript_48600/g.117546 Transcript_48600/m.117546 type:complete len:347 (-) Transcript_48600:56-1096(-)